MPNRRADPSILHADVDSFFASVEQRRDPALRGRAVVVGAGVVMAASYEAKARGVRGGMSGDTARRLCPEAITVDPHFDEYTRASRELFEVFRRTAPTVEGLSLEEAFLDVSGLERISGTAEWIAAKLRREVRDDLGLPISVGVARSKTLAKMASRAAKPDGLLVVPAGGERDFLHPLPVEAIWGVGEATAKRIHRLGVRTVGDLAAIPEASLIAALGRHSGSHLHAMANLREHRRVRPRPRRRSIGSQSAMGRGCHSKRKIERTLDRLVDRVTRRLRNAGRAGRTVVLRLRFGDYSSSTRSRTLPRATDGTDPVRAAAQALLAEARPLIVERGITLVGISITNLDHESAGVQLELPLFGPKTAGLDSAIDTLRERFGTDSVIRGTGPGVRRGFFD